MTRGRHEPGGDRAGGGAHVADLHRDGPPADRRAEREEVAALEVTDLLGLATLHAEQVGRADHVDVEEGAPHQQVRGFRRDVLSELGEPLGGDHAGEPALASATHQVGHRRERGAARVVADLAGAGGREDLRLVDDNQRGVPVLRRRIEQRREEQRGAAHLVVDLEPVERKHDRGAVLANPRAEPGDLGIGARRAVDHHVPERLGEADEIALGIDDDLLHQRRALLEQAAQQMRLARAAVTLDQQPGGEELLDVDLDGGAETVGAKHDLGSHAPRLVRPAA